MGARLIGRRSATAGVVALFAGVGGVAGSYATAGYTPSFVVSPVASFLTWAMPDALLRFAIVTLTDFGRRFGIEHLGQDLNLLLALALTTGLLASLALAAIVTGRRAPSALGVPGPPVAVALAAGLSWAAVAVLTGAPLAAVVPGLAVGSVVAVAELLPGLEGGPSVSAGRRGVLGGVATALGLAVGGYLLGSRGPSGPVADGPGAPLPDPAGSGSGGTAGNRSGESSPGVAELLGLAEARSFDVEGLEALVSGRDFYEVDINNVNPDLDAGEWTLSVTGSVGAERTYDYGDLTSMAAEHRFVSLRCVSDPLNGRQMDNALWTGVPVDRLLDEVDPRGEYVMLRAADGYYEEFPADALRGSFLAYGMDGNVLPRAHGYPVRALVPGHWGEINVKWLTEIEFLDQEADGFWEERGWHGTGPVETVAKLHAVDRREEGHLTVGGHAYAGTRGVDRVEVSTDGGTTWTDARLSEPLPGDDVWRQWAYEYEPPDGAHEVVVRATDGTGALQPQDEREAFPSGATGWVSRTIEP